MSPWLVLVIAGLGTFALRSAMLLRRSPLPDGLQRHLPLVAPSAIAAIAAPALLGLETGPDARTTLSVAIAALATTAVWTWCRTFGLPLLTGMGAWWLSQSALGLT